MIEQKTNSKRGYKTTELIFLAIVAIIPQIQAIVGALPFTWAATISGGIGSIYAIVRTIQKAVESADVSTIATNIEQVEKK
jgi:hypothetical protein